MMDEEDVEIVDIYMGSEFWSMVDGIKNEWRKRWGMVMFPGFVQIWHAASCFLSKPHMVTNLECIHGYWDSNYTLETIKIYKYSFRSC